MALENITAVLKLILNVDEEALEYNHRMTVYYMYLMLCIFHQDTYCQPGFLCTMLNTYIVCTRHPTGFAEFVNFYKLIK